ncbi:MAG: DUF3347 domain-containing protein [Flavobacteriia bacterium]|nr:DUF3347 domain-containing protein [Flavobacteriia bacterium]
MKKTIYVLALITVFFSSCKNNKSVKDSGTMNSSEIKMDSMNEMKMDSVTSTSMTTSKNKITTPIIDAYLQLKNALVADDKLAAADAAKTILKTFLNFDMSKLSSDEHKKYMEIIEDAKEQAEHIAKSPIDHQREHFESLSTDVNDLIALLGTEKTLYQDFCPMAGEGKGAIWLSEFKDIKNPYQGSKMLSCGNLKTQIN